MIATLEGERTFIQGVSILWKRRATLPLSRLVRPSRLTRVEALRTNYLGANLTSRPWPDRPWRYNTYTTVHLGETVVPYATLEPLKAVLPLKHGDTKLPADSSGVGGISLGALGQRMRGRWSTISDLWEENKRPVNRLNLLGRLDFHRELSAQLEWQQNTGDRPIRVVYTSAGVPTAALLSDEHVIVDYKLFWIACKDEQEANYLLAIINSQALYEAVEQFMAKGQFGARDLQKHLWKLPIPEFNSLEPLHVALSEAGQAAAEGAAEQLAKLRRARDRVTVTIARRELRKWLVDSQEGRAGETLVGELLSQ